MGMHKSNSKKPRGRLSIGMKGSPEGQGTAIPNATKLERDAKVRVDGVNRPHGSKGGSVKSRGDRRDTQPQK